MSSTVKAAFVAGVLFFVIVLGFVYFFRHLQGPKAPSQAPTVATPAAAPAAPRLEPQPAPVERPAEGTVLREPVLLTVDVREKGSRRKLQNSWVMVHRASEGDRRGERLWDSQSERDYDGHFEKALEPGTYMVQVQCARYSGQRRDVTVIKDTPLTLVFELERGSSISGRILDTKGAGIAGARVMALKEFAPPDATLEEILIKMVDLPNMTEHIDSETTSGQDGSYQLDGLKEEWFTVRAAARGYAPNEIADIPAPRERIDIVLPAGGNIGGAVRDTAGRPIEGAEIRAYPQVESASVFTVILSKSRPAVDGARSDGSGYYRFETLGTGVFNFLVQAPGHQTAQKMKVAVRPGMENLDFNLAPGEIITGIVEGPSGEPVSGAKVRAQLSGGATTPPGETVKIDFQDGSVLTDERGLFTFDTLKEGEYTLLCWHPDYQTLRRQGVRNGKEEVRLRLDHGGRLAGSVTSADGAPIAGAHFTASDVADFRKEAVSDESGHYVLSGLTTAQRPISVSVNAKGYARLRKEVTAKGNVEIEENFVLQKTGLVHGLILNSNNDPIPGARVMVKKSGENSTGVEQTVGNNLTDNKGRYEIEDVEAGDQLWVTVKKSEYLDEKSEVFTVESGGDTELPTIQLRLGGAIAGKVRDPEGQPITNGMVTVLFDGDTDLTRVGNPSASTNSRGEFRLQGLKAGAVDLEIKAPHFLEKAITGVEVQEGRENREYVTTPIQLDQGNALVGRVVNGAGEAVAGAEVVGRDLAQGATEVRATSGTDGRFKLESIVSTDSIPLQVSHPDYSPFESERVPVGAKEFEVVLRELGRLTGKVMTEDGAPIEAFSVQAQTEGARKDPRKQLKPQTFTGSDGAFEYKGVAGGVYSVSVNAPGHAAATLNGVAVGEGEAVDLGNIVLGVGGIVSGIVTDAESGAPLPGSRVQIVQGASRLLPRGLDPNNAAGGEAGRTSMETDADGAFSFSGLKDGNLSLRISHTGYLTQKIDEINPNLAATARNLQVALSRGGSISGIVLDNQGKARSNMPVYLMGDAPNSNQNTNTDRDGRFRFNAVPAGGFTVKAHRFGPNAGGKPEQAEVRVELGSGASQEVTIQFP